MSIFTDKDMVFTNKDDKLTSGGYEIESSFLNNNIPATYNLNNDLTFGGFGGLAVPSGLLYLSNQSKLTNEMSGGFKDIDENSESIDDDLYEKLLKLAQYDEKNVVQKLEDSPKPKISKHTKRKIHKQNQTRKL
jgi:hypothetical protein